MKPLLSIFCLLLFACANKTGTTAKQQVAVSTPRYYPTYTKELKDNTQILDLTYISWACDCANWITKEDESKYRNTDLSGHCVFIEPADSIIKLPDTLGYSADIIRFTGKFYKEKGYPEKYEMSEDKADRARVFHYTQYEVIKSNYRDFIMDTLNKIK